NPPSVCSVTALCAERLCRRPTTSVDNFRRPLHAALPIYHQLLATEHRTTRQRRIVQRVQQVRPDQVDRVLHRSHPSDVRQRVVRSEEHTSELQSRENLVCRLLLEKKKSARRPASAPKTRP